MKVNLQKERFMGLVNLRFLKLAAIRESLRVIYLVEKEHSTILKEVTMKDSFVVGCSMVKVSLKLPIKMSIMVLS